MTKISFKHFRVKNDVVITDFYIENRKRNEADDDSWLISYRLQIVLMLIS